MNSTTTIESNTNFLAIRNELADLSEAALDEHGPLAAGPALHAEWVVVAIEESTRQIVNAIERSVNGREG